MTTSPEKPSAPRWRWIPLVIICISGVSMSIWVWPMSPDPATDFGRELYVGWRISQGAVLYRDIASFNGPLSPYFTALIFKVFGTSLHALKLANAGWIVVAAWLVYYFVRILSERFTATIATVVFLIMFALAHPLSEGNYSFLTPYSHELPQGVILALASLACLWRWLDARRLIWPAASGFFMGLVFLTKAEVFVAAAVAAVVGLWIFAWVGGAHRREWLAMMALFVASSIAAPLIAVVCLSAAMPAGQALAGVIGPIASVGDARLISLPFYRYLRGTSNLDQSLRLIGSLSMWWLLVIGGPVIAGLLIRRSRLRLPVAVPIAVAVAILTAGMVWLKRHDIHWARMILPIPFFIVATGIVLVVQIRRLRVPRHALELVLTIFSGLLLGKIVFNAAITHYGFALAMPACMLLLTAMLSWLPNWVRSLGGSAMAPRFSACALIAVIVYVHLQVMNGIFRTEKFEIAPNTGDSFLAAERGRQTETAHQWLLNNTSRDQTLVVMPVSPMLNYLARRASPVPYVNYTPGEIIMYGETTILGDLRSHAPDYLAIINTNCSVHGAKSFMYDFGQTIGLWITENYQSIFQIGAPMTDPDHEGLTILKRRSEP